MMVGTWEFWLIITISNMSLSNNSPYPMYITKFIVTTSNI